MVVAVVVVTVAVETAAYRDQLLPSVADGVVGATLLICGVLAWRLRPARRVSALMLISGTTWLLGTLVPAVLLLHRGPLVHLHISYPTGRLRRILAVSTVVVAYVTAIVEPLARNDWLTLAVAALVALAAVDDFARTGSSAQGRPACPRCGVGFAGVLLWARSISWQDGARGWRC